MTSIPKPPPRRPIFFRLSEADFLAIDELGRLMSPSCPLDRTKTIRAAVQGELKRLRRQENKR